MHGRGHLLEGPAIKKPKGHWVGGVGGWVGGAGWAEEGGGRQQRRRLFFLRNEAAERSGRGKAGEWENGADDGVIAPEPSSQTRNPVLLDSPP